MTVQEPETSAPIIYGLALTTPAHVVQRLDAALTRYPVPETHRYPLAGT